MQTQRTRPLVLAFAFLACCALPAAAQGTWERLQTTGDIPSARSTPAVAGLGNSIYLFGGLFDDFATFTNTFYDDTYRLDTNTGVWTQLQPSGTVPPARVFAASAAHPGQQEMLIWGGAVYDFFFSFFNALDDFWAYSPQQNQWRQIVAGNQGPDGRSRPTMWVVGNKVYLFGGITAFFQFKSDLWCYDFDTNLWTQLIPDGAPGSPAGRHEAIAGRSKSAGNTLTIYGGENIDFSTFQFQFLDDTWELDLNTLTWTDVTPAPGLDVSPPQNYGAAGLLGNELVMFGGDLPGGSAGCGAPFDQNPTDKTWAFNTVQHEWIQLFPTGDVPPPLKRTNSAVVRGRLHILSGFGFECPGVGQIFNTDVWVYKR